MANALGIANSGNNGTSEIVHVPAGPNARIVFIIVIFIAEADISFLLLFCSCGSSSYSLVLNLVWNQTLILALRISMEEEAAAKKAAEEASKRWGRTI